MTRKNGNPGAGGAGASKVCSPKQQNTKKVTQPKPMLKVHRASDNAAMTFHGREAQTLDLLIQCGANGLTSGEASPPLGASASAPRNPVTLPALSRRSERAKRRPTTYSVKPPHRPIPLAIRPGLAYVGIAFGQWVRVEIAAPIVCNSVQPHR